MERNNTKKIIIFSFLLLALCAIPTVVNALYNVAAGDDNVETRNRQTRIVGTPDDGGGHFYGIIGYGYGACCSHGAVAPSKGSSGGTSYTEYYSEGGVVFANGYSTYSPDRARAMATAAASMVGYTTWTDNHWIDRRVQTADFVTNAAINYISSSGSVYETASCYSSSDPTTSLDTRTPQYCEYDYPNGMSIDVVLKTGQILAKNIDLTDENQIAKLNEEIQMLAISDTENECNIYFQIGTMKWNIQSGKPLSHNIEITDQLGRNISQKCYFKSGNTWYKFPGTNNESEMRAITNKNMYLMVPYDGVISQISISGKITYNLTYSRYKAIRIYDPNNQDAGSAVRLSNGNKNIEYYVTLDNVSLKNAEFTFYKKNKQVKQNYNEEYPLAKVYFKLKNTIREQYASQKQYCYVGYETYNGTNMFVCNKEESDAYIFETNLDGYFKIKNAIIGEYDIIEVGNTHAGYNSAIMVNVNLTWEAKQTETMYDNQTWISIYGKVWEDRADNIKNTQKDAIFKDGDDILLNDVIVRLKYNGTPMKDVSGLIIQRTYDSQKNINYKMKEDLVVNYPDYDATKGVDVKYTIKTGNENYKFLDVRSSENFAEYRTGDGEFGFIGLKIEDVLAGKYSVEFEYDGIIYKEVDASEFLATSVVTSTNFETQKTQTKGNRSNLVKWEKEKNKSKAYEYQSSSSYPTRGRDEFNEEFSTVEGLKNGEEPDSYTVKQSEFVNAKEDSNPLLDLNITEKIMNYETTRLDSSGNVSNITKDNANEESYKDYSDFINTLSDETYGIIADTSNFNLNFKDLFVYGQTEYIDYVNLGLYRRDEASINLESDLVQVQVNMNGYKHLYWYAQEAEDENSLFNTNTAGVKFHKTYSKGYRRAIYTADAKYQDDTDEKNKLEVYVTYVLKIQNTGTGNVDIGVEELTAYHNDCLEEVAVGFDLDRQTGIVTKDDSITYEKTHTDNPVHGNGQFKFVTSKIKIEENTNIINCHGQSKIDGTVAEPSQVLKTSSDAQKDCSTQIFIKYKLTQEKIYEIAKEDSIYDEYLHQIFEVEKYSLYKQEQETTKGLKDGTQQKGKYFPFAGVITGTNPENCDPCENKHQLMYFESDTAYAPIIKLEFNGERGIGGIVVEDNSVLEEEKDVNINEEYILGQYYSNPSSAVATANQGLDIDPNDILVPFNTRNGDGIITEDELNQGVGGVPVLLRSVASDYEYYDEEEEKTTTINRIMMNYRTVTVPKDGTYGFRVKLIKRNSTSDVSYADELKNVPQYNDSLTFLETSNIETDDKAVSYATVASLFEQVSLDEVLEQDEMRHYILKNNIEIYFEPCSVSDATCSYVKENMKAGEYYFPDVVPNNYKMTFMWNGQQRLRFIDKTDSEKLNEITTYTTEKFKSSIVNEDKFKEDAKNDWYTTNKTRENDAIDSFGMRKIIDKVSGQSQDSENVRDTLKYGDYTMISYSPKFILKIESDDNVYEQDTIETTAPATDITQYTPKEKIAKTEEKHKDYDVSPIDFALTLRPQQAIDTLKSVVNVRLTTANGTVMIDQNVYNKDTSEFPSLLIVPAVLPDRNSAKIEIILDDEIRKNSVLELTYRNEIMNISEIDYAEESYYLYGKVQDKQKSIVCLRVQDVYEAPTDNSAQAFVESEKTTLDAQGKEVKEFIEITGGSDEWKKITQDQYDKEEQPVTPNVNTTDKYDASRFIHADEVKRTQTITENIVTQEDIGQKLNNDDLNYIYNPDGNQISTTSKNNNSTQEWKQDLINIRDYTKDQNGNVIDRLAIDGRNIYKATLAFQDQMVPGQISTRLFKTITKITSSDTNLLTQSATVFNNFVEVGSVYSKIYEEVVDNPQEQTTPITTTTTGGLDLTSDLIPTGTNTTVHTANSALESKALKYYGSPIKYCSSVFKACAAEVSIIPPTGGNKNYVPYIVTAILAFMTIAFGIVIIMLTSKKDIVSIVDEDKN